MRVCVYLNWIVILTVRKKVKNVYAPCRAHKLPVGLLIVCNVYMYSTHR